MGSVEVRGGSRASIVWSGYLKDRRAASTDL